MTPLDIATTVQGSYVSLPHTIWQAGEWSVSVQIGPLADAFTVATASVQRASDGGWIDVGGLTASGGGSHSCMSAFQAKIGEQYRLSVLVVGSPTAIVASGG